MAHHVRFSEWPELFEKIGDEFIVQVDRIMWNDEIAALPIDLLKDGLTPFVYCKDEEYPHITLAKKSKEIPSVTAGDMCGDPVSNSKPLREVLKIRGKLIFQ